MKIPVKLTMFLLIGHSFLKSIWEWLVIPVKQLLEMTVLLAFILNLRMLIFNINLIVPMSGQPKASINFFSFLPNLQQ